MARLPRSVAVNTPHNVTQRGNARQFILSGDAERLVAKKWKRPVCPRFPLDWYMVVISSNSEDPIHYSRYTGATVTINTSILGDENQVEDVMSHEVGHVNHARTKPDENGRESAHTHFTHGAQDHDQRPEEKKANEFKEKVKADRKRYKEAQARAKKAEKHKKKDTTTP
jgi:hypothetical protein